LPGLLPFDLMRGVAAILNRHHGHGINPAVVT
jgi:hypothetical protein